MIPSFDSIVSLTANAYSLAGQAVSSSKIELRNVMYDYYFICFGGGECFISKYNVSIFGLTGGWGSRYNRKGTSSVLYRCDHTQNKLPLLLSLIACQIVLLLQLNVYLEDS